MRLPNGYGSVRKLSGKRRNPWIVEKTVALIPDMETMKLKQKRVTLGYYPTRAAALQALADYNTNPYDLDAHSVTFEEIYQKWRERHKDKVTEKTISCYDAAFGHTEAIWERPMASLRAQELQTVMDECQASSSTKANIKSIMSACFEYCIKNGLLNTNYAKYVEYEATDSKIDRFVFSQEEIDGFWALYTTEAKIILILLYTGMRVNELLKMPRECCHLNERYLDITKSKTDCGIRHVPIHDKIYPIVKEFYDKNTEMLITNDNGYNVAYNNFVSRNWIPLLKSVNADTGHHFHDTRHTFITEGQEVMRKLYLQKIVGHRPSDITDSVYTHLKDADIYKEIQKIRY